MNSAGKKLQDIYDAGSAKLRELQTSQESSLKNASDSHGSTAKTAQKAAAEGPRALRRSPKLSRTKLSRLKNI
jgi:hypothetical protein